MAPPSPDTILYVDDEAALLEITKLFLERAGDIAVDTTTNPLEAYEMIVAGRYDAVVSDYLMPEMDGIALLKRVRGSGSQVPFIIFTGRGREEVAIEALNNGANFYLQKGGDPKAQFTELANAIRQLAGRQRAEVAVLRTKEMLQKTESLAHLGSWILDCETGQITWSDETYRIFNLTPGECVMTYEAFLSMVHPDDRALVDTAYSTSIVDGKSTYTVEHRIIRAYTGEIRYVVEHCEHLRDESGRVIRSHGMLHDITERKLAELELLQEHERLQAAHEELATIEEELRTSFDDLAESRHRVGESEKLYRRISESISDVVYVCNFQSTGEWVMSQITGAVHEITGYTDTEALAMRCWKHLIHPDDLPLFEREICSLLPDMSSVAELRILHRDGSIRWIRVSARCIGIPGGGWQLYGGWHDITVRKQTEADLRETKEYLESLIEHTSAPVVVWNPECIIIRSNRAFERLTGIPADEVIGQGIEVIFPEESRGASMELIRRAMAGELLEDREIPIMHRPGGIRIVLWNSANIIGHDGVTLVSTIAQGKDITARKQAEAELLQKHEDLQTVHEELATTEEELRTSFDDLIESQRQTQESERRLAAIIDFLPDATLVIDEDGCVIAWNRAIEKMTGVPKAEMLGRGGYAYAVPFHGEARPVLVDYILRPDGAADCPYDVRVIDGEIFEAEVDLAYPGGREASLMIRASPLYDQGGRRTGAIEIIRDVTESMAMKREIECHVAELSRQANRLAAVNKKLNLMNSITRHDALNQLMILLANLSFAREAGDGQDISMYLSRMKDAADRIGRQIEFTRDYAGLGVQAPEWQRISDVIRSAAPDGLPIEDESGDLAVYADPMLTRAFANLMDNTMRHGESASRVRVRHWLEGSGDLVLVWEDDGIGVPPEEKELIFRRGSGKNTGLGLFLIREILEITGIAITETGEHGKGARFEMRVPDGMYRV